MIPTPITDAAEAEQNEVYENLREAGWPQFPADFEFARLMEERLHKAQLVINAAVKLNEMLQGYIIEHSHQSDIDASVNFETELQEFEAMPQLNP